MKKKMILYLDDELVDRPCDWRATYYYKNPGDLTSPLMDRGDLWVAFYGEHGSSNTMTFQGIKLDPAIVTIDETGQIVETVKAYTNA